MSAPYLSHIRAVERFFDEHGDSYRGVGWTKTPETAARRHDVMLGVIRSGPEKPVDLLDFGSGLAHLYEHIRDRGLDHISYSGLDLSPRMLAAARRKHPSVTFHEVDVLRDPDALPEFDYVVMSGLFTFKGDLSHDEMLRYSKELIRVVFDRARVGIAFNATTKYVEWERDDLFHLPFDELAAFLASEITRHFVIRHDYRLWEYTTYAYR